MNDGWNTLSPRKINAAPNPPRKATLMEKQGGGWGGVKDEAQTFSDFQVSTHSGRVCSTWAKKQGNPVLGTAQS